MAKFPCLFVLLFVVTVKGFSSEPNIQLSLTDKGLDYVSRVLVHNLVNHVQGLVVPPITLRKGITLILYNSRVNQVQMKSASFGANNGFLELEIHMNDLAIRGDYISKGWWWFNGMGGFTVDLKGLDITQRLSIGHNDKGQPVVATEGCMTRIHTSSYRFDHSLVLSIISNLAKRSFQPMLERKICDAVSKAVQKKAKMLPTLYPENHLLPGVPCSIISYPITQKPIVEQHYVDFLITGKVKSPCSPSNSSSASADKKFMRFVPNKDKMLSISLSDDFLSLLFKRYYKAGVMTLVSTELNKNSSSKVSIKAVDALTIRTTVNGSVLSFKAKTTMVDSRSMKPLTTEITDNYEIKLSSQEERKKLSAKLRNLRTHSKTSLASKIVDKHALQVIKRKTSELVKKLNGSLKDLVPLPLTDAMRLVGQTIRFQQGRITFEMDIQV